MSRITIPTEAVDRIVKSVGPKVTLVQAEDDVIGPPDPNKDLSYRLNQSLGWYYVARERRSDADKKLQIRRLVAISKAGTKLRNLLKADQDWEWFKQFHFEILPDEIGHLLNLVEREIRDLETKIEWGDDWNTDLASRERRDLIRTRSPFEWLAGTYLADDYRVCFGREPSLRRATDGGLDGPYIRFVDQILVEFDVKNGNRPFSREAIAKAVTKARKKP